MDKKFAIIGDIHSNLEALAAVVDDARTQGATDFVCVGDIVGYNASPRECVELVRSLDCVTVCGNHDHYCSHSESLDDFHPLAASVIEWTRRQLPEEHIDWLQNLKLQAVVPGGGFMIVHSTLDMPERWGYVFDTLEAEAHLSYQNMALCFHGHTHVPIVFEKQRTVVRTEPVNTKIVIGRKYFINTGSVGQPRDGDPRASYCIYDARLREVEFRRVGYDIASAQARIRAANLPERLAHRLALGR